MIEIKGLYFSYNKNSPYILNDLNLNIEKGSYLSVVGENGCGKSTLMKIILKLLKPTKGQVKVTAKNVGYVPQRLDNFNAAFPITVYEILYSHMKILKLKDKNIILKVLNYVKMENYKNSLIGNLSGGQQQKIFIARALIGNPDLIILDEPSAGLDSNSQKHIYSILKELRDTKGITIVTVEHNLKAAAANSTHIYKINKGNGTLFSIKDYKEHINNTEVSLDASNSSS